MEFLPPRNFLPLLVAKRKSNEICHSKNLVDLSLTILRQFPFTLALLKLASEFEARLYRM